MTSMEGEKLNRSLSIPLHYQLMLILKKRIISGIYPVGSKIPNEMQLCMEFEVSRPTVRKAIEQLADAGLLVTVHPKGSFVQEVKDTEPIEPTEEVNCIPEASSNMITVSLESPLHDCLLYQITEEFRHHTGIKVQIVQSGSWKDGMNSVVNTIIENRVPDIFLVSNVSVAAFANMGMIQPFDRFMDEESLALLKAREWRENHGQYLYNDLLYGYPFFSETRLMYYRKDYFDELGLPYPTAGWTHDDFLEMGKALTKPEKARWGYAFPTDADADTFQTFMTWVMQRGGRIYQKHADGTVAAATDDPAFVEAFQWVCELMLKHKICPPIEQCGDYSKLCTLFLDGHISMMIGLPAFRLALEDRIDGQWGIAPLPRGPHSGNGYRGRMPLCISTKSKNPEQCWKFIQYLTEKRNLFPYSRRVGIIPAMELYSEKEILAFHGEEIKDFLEAMGDTAGWDQFFISPNNGIDMEAWQMPIQYTMRRVLQKEVNYEQAIQYITLAVGNLIK